MAFNDNNRTINAGKNAIAAIANKIIFIVLTFVSRKFFIQYIGVEYLGINGLFTNVLTILSMADMGLATAMNVSLYKPIAENDTNKIAALLQYYKKLYRYIAIAVLIIGMSVIPFLKYIVNMEQDIPYLYVYYMVFVIKNVVSYLFVYKSSIIKADQKTHLVTKIDIYINAIKIALQIITILIFKNYLIYILLDVAKVIAHNIVVSIIADKQYSFINDEVVSLTEDEKHTLFSDISSMFIYKVARTFLVGTDNIIMSVVVGTVYVGYYSNYHSITHTIESLIALVFTSLTAGIGNLVVTSSAKKRYQTFKSIQMVSFWISSFVCVCLCFLTQDFISLWFGEKYLLDNLAVTAIIINVYFDICMRPVWAFREGTGMYNKIKYVMVFTAIINVVLSVILGKQIGISGIIFATTISKIVTYFWYEPVLLFKDVFKVKALSYYIDYLKNIILMLVCISISYYPISLLNTNVWGWLIKAIICLIVVNVIYMLKYYRSEEFKIIRVKFAMLVKYFVKKT